MAMMALVDPGSVWRQQQRRELAQDNYERELAELAAKGPDDDDEPRDPPRPPGPIIVAPEDNFKVPLPRVPGWDQHPNPSPPVYTPGPNTGEPVPPGGPPGTVPRTDRGSGTGHPNVPYTGFDFTQDPNNRLIGKSAKYTLADAIRQATEAGVGDIWRTKAGAQFFAENYIKPFFEENGFEVLEIVGDKMRVRDHEDRAAGRPGSWIDWVVGADGPNAQIGFQVEQERQRFGPLDSRANTISFGDPRSIPGLTSPLAPTPPPTTTTPATTADERAYRMLARREARRMERLAGRER